jgi:hypothetical protein
MEQRAQWAEERDVQTLVAPPRQHDAGAHQRAVVAGHAGREREQVERTLAKTGDFWLISRVQAEHVVVEHPMRADGREHEQAARERDARG